MKIRFPTFALSSIVVACLLPGLSAAAVQAELFVSPDGSGGACTISAPCALSAAPAAVRALSASQTGDIIVNLRDGTYRLSAPLQLGPEDSGKNGFNIIYQAASGETPMLVGSIPVTGFRVFDSAKNIWVADVPAGSNSRQLFVNGRRAIRARNGDNSTTFTLSGSSFITGSASFRSFTNQNHVELVQNYKWKHMRCPLASITASGSGSSLNIQSDCWADNRTAVNNPGFPFNGNGLPVMGVYPGEPRSTIWVENAFQLLDQAGEFYLDRVANRVFYIPRSGDNMATASAEMPVLENLVSMRGTPGHLAIANQNDSRAVYTGTWSTSSGREFGDFKKDVRVTSTNGSSVTITFNGTGIDVLAETNTDQGSFTAFVDGVQDTSRSWTENGSSRLAQQVVYSRTGLPNGTHTLRLVKTGGTNFLIDAFVVIPDVIAPIQNITWKGVTFSYTGWTLPSSVGYIDNQGGIVWHETTGMPQRAPAALKVQRGRNITVTDSTFKGLGGNGVDLADGTQDSKVLQSTVSDVSAIGIVVGEMDDHYLTHDVRQTRRNTVSDNRVTFMGQDYQSAVGIMVGHAVDTVIAHNLVTDGPYTGISLGWGWGYAAACSLQSAEGRTNCRRGTLYAATNKIQNNRVERIMQRTHDGGAVYTLGGQNGNGPNRSVVSHNYLVAGIHNNKNIYHDEGSSFWDTHHNVVQGTNGFWAGTWTPTSHHNNIHDCWVQRDNRHTKGSNWTWTNIVEVPDANWPSAARTIINNAGPRTTVDPVPTLSATPAERSVTAGTAGSATYTVSASGGNENVTLSLTGLPTGATATFNPTVISGTGGSSSTLQVNTTASTPEGSHTLTVRGTEVTSGSSAQSTTVKLNVVGTQPVCVNATSNAAWHNNAFATQTGTFTAEFDATPSATLNAVMGLSNGPQTGYAGLAAIARFNASGNIDARNGGTYTATNTIPYTGGTTYRFRLVVNVATKRYSIFVTPAGQTERVVGENFAFRTEQAGVTQLNNWAVNLATTPAGSLSVCNFEITP